MSAQYEEFKKLKPGQRACLDCLRTPPENAHDGDMCRAHLYGDCDGTIATRAPEIPRQPDENRSDYAARVQFQKGNRPW